MGMVAREWGRWRTDELNRWRWLLRVFGLTIGQALSDAGEGKVAHVQLKWNPPHPNPSPLHLSPFWGEGIFSWDGGDCYARAGSIDGCDAWARTTCPPSFAVSGPRDRSCAIRINHFSPETNDNLPM